MNRRVVTMALSRQGGLNQCTHAFNMGLVDLGWDVLHVTSKGYELAHMPHPYEVLEVFDMLRTDPRDVVRLLGSLRRWGPVAVHLNGAEHPLRYLALFALLRPVLPCPLVYGAHNVTPQWTEERARTGTAQRWVLKALGALADRVVVSAEENKRRLQQLTDLPSRKIEVIPIGNNLPLREPATDVGAWDPDRSEPPPTTGTNVLFFGNIVATKGLCYLLEAFPRVLQSCPGARLRIVGRPVEPFERYDRLARDLSITDQVETVLEFVPFEEVLLHFRWSDLLVLPYVQTSQSGVIFTASAVARPTVVTSVGGLPEAVEHGRSGLVVPPGDPEALAEAIVRLLTRDGERASMGRRAQVLCDTTFSWRTIARMTADLYLRMAEDRGAPA
jgi:glycosyltransferase involved in cell wall biosynthesis